MIYEYEAMVLKHINASIPEIKLATYAKGPEMFKSLAQVQKLPSFYYCRNSDEWTFPPTWQVLDCESDKRTRFVPVPQTYIGRIYVANAGDALYTASTLRFYWANHSYVWVPWNESLVRVALRLLYIKAEEEKNVTDKTGPLRFVEFSWSSQLFMSDTDIEAYTGLVKEVHIFLDQDGCKIMSDNNLIKVIK